MSMAAQVEGVTQLGRTLHSCAAELADLADPDAAAAAIYVELVRPTIPRKSGRLAASVQTSGPVITATAPYAAYVNARKPFFVPIDSPQLLVPYQQHLDRALARVEGK